MSQSTGAQSYNRAYMQAPLRQVGQMKSCYLKARPNYYTRGLSNILWDNVGTRKNLNPTPPTDGLKTYASQSATFHSGVPWRRQADREDLEGAQSPQFRVTQRFHYGGTRSGSTGHTGTTGAPAQWATPNPLRLTWHVSTAPLNRLHAITELIILRYILFAFKGAKQVMHNSPLPFIQQGTSSKISH